MQTHFNYFICFCFVESPFLNFFFFFLYNLYLNFKRCFVDQLQNQINKSKKRTHCGIKCIKKCKPTTHGQLILQHGLRLSGLRESNWSEDPLHQDNDLFLGLVQQILYWSYFCGSQWIFTVYLPFITQMSLPFRRGFCPPIHPLSLLVVKDIFVEGLADSRPVVLMLPLGLSYQAPWSSANVAPFRSALIQHSAIGHRSPKCGSHNVRQHFERECSGY